MKNLLIDELNTIPSESMRSEPYDKYFERMEISDEQKQKRIEFSKNFEPIMLYVLSLAVLMISNESIDREYLKSQIVNQYLNLVGAYIPVDDYLMFYINTFAEQIVKSTFENNGEYFLSYDRARFVSECEANTILNYSDFVDAVSTGKKYKTWVDIQDNKERKTHKEVGGKKIPITEAFAVGNSLLMYPKDNSFGASASEIVNCRCTVKYS